MGAGIHLNRIARTGFHAETAIDAAQRIDFVAHRILLDRIMRIFTGLDMVSPLSADMQAGSGAKCDLPARLVKVILQACESALKVADEVQVATRVSLTSHFSCMILS